MLEALSVGVVIGLLAGLAPGPFAAYVAATSMEHGLRAGLKVALAPLGVETPPLIVSVVFLGQLSFEALRWVGLVGGCAMVALGIKVWVRSGRYRGTARVGDERPRLWDLLELVGAGLLSPGPWVFWAVVGGPFLLRSWHRGAGDAVVFVASFYVFFVASQMLIAWGADRGLRLLTGSWKGWVMRIVASVIVVTGLGLAWLSYRGDFQTFVSTEKKVQESFADRA